MLISSTALTLRVGAQVPLRSLRMTSRSISVATPPGAGRGWIAVVAVMLGRNNPLYAAGACVLFGFADALSVNLQSQGLPNQLTDISPYLATLAALVISHRRRTRAARPLAEVNATSAAPTRVSTGESTLNADQ